MWLNNHLFLESKDSVAAWLKQPLLKRLNQARGVLLFVGAITLIYNFNLYMNADAELNLEIAKLGPNKQVNLRSYAEILMFLYIFTTVPS